MSQRGRLRASRRKYGRTERRLECERIYGGEHLDAQGVSDDLSALQSAVQAATGDSLAGDLQQTQTDLGQTNADLHHVLGEAGHVDSATVCSDADTVSTDADTVQNDFYTIQNDQNSSGGDSGSITAAIKQLQQDQGTLDADRSSDPADVPSSAPSDGQIAQAITGAQPQTGRQNGTNRAVAQVQGMSNTAQGHASKAQSACSTAGG